ncbi:M61 family peptidase [Chakrabartia godavariana]|nr:M61 family peptidase [Chakrabartia godavariana]
MKFRLAVLPLSLFSVAISAQSIPQARDVAFPGTMTLDVDATDIDRAIFNVRQAIPVPAAGPMVLLFPEWIPGSHAARGEIEKLAGLEIRADGKLLEWRRDATNVYAFHLNVPSGAKALDVSFKFLSATERDQGRVVVTPDLMNLQWQSVSLYPAGWFTRRIPVSATVTWPNGWKAATALRPASSSGNTVRYQTVDYETLIDSPVFAGRHFAAVDLGRNVTLNLVADDAKYLTATQGQIDVHRRLVDQAAKLFGMVPFDRYDFLMALTDQLGGIGREHHRSSENSANPEYFTDWASGPGRRNLLAHEFSHSWIGKYRRPAGQMVPDFSTPLVNDLLWVYEGQDQFWGYVLGARSGLFTKQETLDAFASIAANQDIRRARDWRDVEDTTRDPIITDRRPKGWLSYQRSEDYYNEGLLIWLEVDSLLRARTGGTKGMQDFVRQFVAGPDGKWDARGFTRGEIVSILNTLSPFDWDGFFRERINGKAPTAPLSGLTLGGYRLTFGSEPTAFFRDQEKRSGELNFNYSLGMSVSKGGHVTGVIWDGPAFKAGLTTASEVLAVNGRTYAEDTLRDAIITAEGGKDPIKLIVRTGRVVREVALSWNGGLRYPRLEKVGVGETSIDRLLSPLP